MFHICRSQDLFLWLPYICITFSLLGCCWLTEILCSLRKQNSLFLYNLCLLGRCYPLLFVSFTRDITYLAPVAYFACTPYFLCAYTKIIYGLALAFHSFSLFAFPPDLLESFVQVHCLLPLRITVEHARPTSRSGSSGGGGGGGGGSGMRRGGGFRFRDRFVGQEASHIISFPVQQWDSVYMYIQSQKKEECSGALQYTVYLYSQYCCIVHLQHAVFSPGFCLGESQGPLF